MEKKDLQTDMAIYISKNCKYTRDFFGWNKEMDKYKGSIQIIDSFNIHSNDYCFVECYDTKSYKWSIRDLEFLPKSPKPKLIHFDPKELIL